MNETASRSLLPAAFCAWLALVPATAANAQQYRAVGGLAVYLGVIPAQVLRGHTPGRLPQPPPHGRAPRGVHQYHLTAALFDEKTGERVSDARVSATIAGLGLAGSRIELKAMQIEGTVTYGGYFNLPGEDRYTIRIEMRRPNRPAVTAVFTYEHRLR
ncbi:MAG TPA: hypothetical protein VIF14_12230 [Alphaproteobacteria bacterium]|jgi:hypothetical protein